MDFHKDHQQQSCYEKEIPIKLSCFLMYTRAQLYLKESSTREDATLTFKREEKLESDRFNFTATSKEICKAKSYK